MSAVETPSAPQSGRATCRHAALVAKHFKLRISPSGERALRAHLLCCARCQASYERHRIWESADPDGGAGAEARIGRGLGLALGDAASRRAWAIWLVPALTACCLALVWGLPPHPARDDAPVARGGASKSHLLAYAWGPDGASRPLASAVSARQPLAFAYANAAGKKRLAVFAVDAARRVYWYVPTWQNANENPVAPVIEQDAAVHEIPRAVSHELRPGRLQIFGVFLDDAVTAQQIEAAVASAPARAGGGITLALRAGDVTEMNVQVTEGAR
jgi:hypothetical protein